MDNPMRKLTAHITRVITSLRYFHFLNSFVGRRSVMATTVPAKTKTLGLGTLRLGNVVGTFSANELGVNPDQDEHEEECKGPKR